MKNPKPLYKHIWPWLVLALIIILALAYPALSQMLRLWKNDALKHSEEEDQFYQEQGYYPLEDNDIPDIPEEDFVTTDLPVTMHPPAPYPKDSQWEYDQYVNSAPENVKIPLPENNYNRWKTVEALVPDEVYLTERGTRLLNMTDLGFVLELEKGLTGAVNFSDAVVKKGDSCTVWVTKSPYKTVEEHVKESYAHRSAWPNALVMEERKDLATEELSVWELRWKEEGYPEWMLLFQGRGGEGVYTLWYFLGNEVGCDLAEPIVKGFHFWQYSLPKVKGDREYEKPFTNDELSFESTNEGTVIVNKKNGYKVILPQGTEALMGNEEGYYELHITKDDSCAVDIKTRNAVSWGEALENDRHERDEIGGFFEHMTYETTPLEHDTLEGFKISWIFNPDDGTREYSFLIKGPKYFYFLDQRSMGQCELRKNVLDGFKLIE